MASYKPPLGVTALEFPGRPRAVLAVTPVPNYTRRRPLNGEGFPAILFSHEELLQAKQYQSPRRRAEFLAGRLAGKGAVSKFLCTTGIRVATRSVLIEPVPSGLEAGRPVVRRPAIGGICDVSISHSHGLAAAVACAQARVGVDIEFITPRPQAFVETAFVAEEREWLHDCAVHYRRPVQEFWNLGWCIKEAMSKVLGQGLRAALSEIVCTSWHDYELPRFNVPYLSDDTDMMARTVKFETGDLVVGDVTGLVAIGSNYALAVLCRWRIGE